MQHYAAFHLGLHCLPKYKPMGFQNRKGKHRCIIKLTGFVVFQESCTAQGGYLVKIDDATEDEYLRGIADTKS